MIIIQLLSNLIKFSNFLKISYKTIVFYNEGSKSKVSEFKKSKINLIKSKINKDKKFDIKIIMKKLYHLGSRNILIEGGNDLTNHLLKKKIFNQFYSFF